MGVFSTLPLTQTLPFLPLAQGDIDYQVERRSRPHVIEEALAERDTTVIVVRDGSLAVPREHATLGGGGVSMRPATLPGPYVLRWWAHHRGVVAMYLGSLGREGKRQVVALDISRAMEEVPGAVCAAVPGSDRVGVDAAFDGSVPGMPGTDRRTSPFVRMAERFEWVDLRDFAPRASASQVGQATTAIALGAWHARQRHCPACGAIVDAAMGGWAQRCGLGGNDGHLLFPRIEPSIIVAVVDGDDRLLLQHNKSWSDGTMYSVTAGFVEAGENLEHACRRETLEETGIRLGQVCYVGSQPWPFPSSLMVAFRGGALDTRVRVDGVETCDARWVTRDELARELASGRMTLPGKASIARGMIEQWYGRAL